MIKKHVVKQGECIASLAYTYGLPRNRIWDDPENEALRTLRGDPFVLFPGDEVVIPEPQVKTVPAETGKTHPFRLKSEKVRVRLRLLEGDRALANEAYVFTVGENNRTGTTDAEGKLVEEVGADVMEARLDICGRRILLKLGYLDPASELSGIQARLNNLDYGAGPVDGVMGPMTHRALGLFQKASAIKTTRDPNPATRDKLKNAHGC